MVYKTKGFSKTSETTKSSKVAHAVKGETGLPHNSYAPPLYSGWLQLEGPLMLPRTYTGYINQLAIGSKCYHTGYYRTEYVRVFPIGHK